MKAFPQFPSFRVSFEDLVNFQLPEDPTARASSQLAQVLAKKKDDELGAALQALMGRKFIPDELCGRLTRHINKENQNEVWYLDGQPVMEFRPVTTKTVTKPDGSIHVVCTRKFRHLKAMAVEAP